VDVMVQRRAQAGNPARPVWPGQKSERPVVAMKRLITVERRSLTWSK